MPELPEVETIRNSLASNIGACIMDIELKRSDIMRREDFPPQDLVGQTITEIRRRGKYLAILLDQGSFLVVHLGMSGRFYMQPESEELLAPHVHFIVCLNNGIKLAYQDARRFGGIWLCSEVESIFASMGVEPLSPDFTVDYLENIAENSKVAIKTLLLNQKLISGIGNIYADEALFAAGIRGHRPASSLTAGELKQLHRSIIKVLEQSIKERGTTFRDFRDGYNQSGNFQNLLRVYGRINQACTVCGEVIQKEKIGGRSSHFCSICQK